MRTIQLLAVVFTLVLAPFLWSQGGVAERLRDQDRDLQSVSDVEQEREHLQDRDPVQDCPGFVDEDGDGVCDLCSVAHDPQQRDQDRDRDQAQDCPGFVDEDGDGVCDLCGAEHDPQQDRERLGRRFLRGDADGNGRREMTDAMHILRGLFGGAYLDCADAADVNDDGAVDVSDAVLLLRSMFCASPPPIPVPFRNAGNDPTPDGLLCG